MDARGAAEGHGEQPSIKPPNLRRSCEPCRTSKSRCAPSSDDAHRCQRCVRDGKQCVYAETRQRPKKMRSSKARVAEMEQRLDSIMTLLAANRSPGSILDMEGLLSSTPAESPPTRVKPQPAASPKPHVKVPSAPNASSSQSLSYTFAAAKPSASNNRDIFDKGIISFEVAEGLLADFRGLSYNLPFVILDPRQSLQSLRYERPFLLLGVLATSSNVSVPLQEAIELELRETLSRRVTMNGETSLDILQGLLVYIAWYHFHIRADRLRVFQLCQMAVTMAIDLGITKPTKQVGGDSRTPESTALSPSDAEERRAFLGCYYLSSSLAVTLRKPPSMKYISYMGECCQLLAAANIAPTDCLLQCFIHLQELAGDVCDQFDYNGYLQLPPLSALRIDILLKSFRKRHSELGAVYQDYLNSNITLRILYQSLSVHMYEIALHASNPLSSETKETPGRDSWYFSSARTDALISGLEACKNLLDSYIAISVEDHHKATLPQVTQVLYTVLLLSQMARGIDTPHLDAKQISTLTNAKYYVDALARCIDSLIASQSRNGSGFFWHFRRVFTQRCLWGHIAFGQEGFPTEVSDACLTFINIPSDMELTEGQTLEESSKTTTALVGSTNTPQVALPGPSDQEWLDMVADWPAQFDLSMPMF